ncbi:TPA: ISL3 family transposase [Streptococcus suis]|nr:ISL3 family transposase [Streptococcus suis]
MSTNLSNYISQMLSIKDANISFLEKIYVKKINKLNTIVHKAHLTYIPKACPKCGNCNSKLIIKHGSKKTFVRLAPVNGQPTALELKKQRFLCKECKSTFIAETNIVKKHHSISSRLKALILDSLSKKISEKDIAKLNTVSHSTVSRYIDKDFTKFSPKNNFLPKHLSFDEFKSTKDAKGSMSFIVTNLEKDEVFDIVENRQLPSLMRYFNKFTRKARSKVKTIVIDMYEPYITLIKKLFPNASIIFDRFHIVNHLSRALSKTRIDVMKKFSTKSMEYKRLKKYWKLIQKDFSKLDTNIYKKRTHFRDLMSETGIVNHSVSCDHILEETYNIYQELLLLINIKDYDGLKKHLKTSKKSGSKYLQAAIKTLLVNFDYVKNALIYKYSNGFTEGINNFIKVLKRIAFGYKSFFHFRNRILITFNLKKKLTS